MIRLPPVLRPRWTIRYLLCSALALYFAYCTLFGMRYFSSDLPPYTGEYDVGVVDIEAPCEPRQIGKGVLKESGEPALQLETVLFSLYYPSVEGARSDQAHHTWIPKPVGLHGEGYARFIHANNWFTNSVFTFGLWALAGGNAIPAKVDVPIHGTARPSHESRGLAEQPDDDYGLPAFPVIVFSHGMASSRTSYTQWCGELASRGFVVAAIEHRDGSGPGSIMMKSDGTVKNIYHVSPDDVDPAPEVSAFKQMQLDMRQAEVEETVRVLRSINAGDGAAIFESSPRKEGRDLQDWTNRLNMDHVVVAGHSYGATLALQALKGSPSDERPFKGGIILDPGKQSGPLNHDIDVPVAIVHSESWSSKHSIFQGRAHFEVVKELTEGVLERVKYAWFVTSKGTSHPSVTDAPLIEPFLLSWTTGASIDVKDGISQYVKIAQEFMQYLDDGHRRGILAEEVTHPEYNKQEREDVPKSISKFWQIHVAPTTFCPYPGLCGVEKEEDKK
ncbi:hypothetical protein MBLNU230_g2932t1 [Neophaeotheca triangularis]